MVHVLQIFGIGLLVWHACVLNECSIVLTTACVELPCVWNEIDIEWNNTVNIDIICCCKRIWKITEDTEWVAVGKVHDPNYPKLETCVISAIKHYIKRHLMVMSLLMNARKSCKYFHLRLVQTASESLLNFGF